MIWVWEQLIFTVDVWQFGTWGQIHKFPVNNGMSREMDIGNKNTNPANQWCGWMLEIGNKKNIPLKYGVSWDALEISRRHMLREELEDLDWNNYGSRTGTWKMENRFNYGVGLATGPKCPNTCQS